MSQTEKDQKSGAARKGSEKTCWDGAGWGVQGWKSRVSEEWSLAEGRRRRDREGKGSRLDEEEESPGCQGSHPTRRPRQGGGARVLLLRDFAVPPRGRADVSAAASQAGAGAAPPAAARLPPARPAPRPAPCPPAPAPAASSASAARGRPQHGCGAGAALSGCSCSGRLGGAGPAGAGPRPALAAQACATQNAAVSAGRAAAACPGIAGRERGRPASRLRGAQAGRAERRRRGGRPPGPGGRPSRFRAPQGQPASAVGGRGSLPPTSVASLSFFLRGRRRGMGVRPGGGPRSFLGAARNVPSAGSPWPEGRWVARRAPRAPRAAGERFPAPVAGSSLGAVRGRMRRDSVGGFLPQVARAGKTSWRSSLRPSASVTAGLGPPFSAGIGVEVWDEPESRHAVCSKVSSRLFLSPVISVLEGSRNSSEGRASGRPKSGLSKEDETQRRPPGTSRL